jgi:ABC-type amino acid transport substrate-binding protein
MNVKRYHFGRTVFILMLICFVLLATEDIYPQSDTNKMIVGVKNTPPFIIKQDESQYKGVSIQLWEEIARQMDIQYTYKEYNLTGLLEALENKELDVCINPLTVTSDRMKRFNFTQPFFISNLCIAVREEGGSDFVSFIKSFFSLGFLKIVLLLFGVILAFGILLWLAEKRKNPSHFRKGFKGIFDGLWFSAVTMTTVGYGDKAPLSRLGKILTLVWMFTAIIVISSFTAGITSALTINELESNISNVNDLKKVPVGTVKGSSSGAYLSERGIDFISYSTVEKGLSALANSNIDAFVYDEPIIRYYLKNIKGNKNLQVLPYKFNSQYYSFAIPYGDKLVKSINPILFQVIESAYWKQILQEFNLEYAIASN